MPKHLALFLTTVLCVVITPWLNAESIAEHAAALVGSADGARIRGDVDKTKNPGLVVNDQKWIQMVSKALAECPLNKVVCCMCAGYQTVTFLKKGEFVIEVTAIHGNQLRLHWNDGKKAQGGDFPIDAAHWKIMNGLLELPQKLSPPAEKKPPLVKVPVELSP